MFCVQDNRERAGLEKWKEQSRAWREEMGVKEGARPWTSSAEFQGIGVKHTARCLEIIDLVALQNHGLEPIPGPRQKRPTGPSVDEEPTQQGAGGLKSESNEKMLYQEWKDPLFDNIINDLFL